MSISSVYGVFPKIWENPPNHPMFNPGFPIITIHFWWGKKPPPIFGSTPISRNQSDVHGPKVRASMGRLGPELLGSHPQVLKHVGCHPGWFFGEEATTHQPKFPWFILPKPVIFVYIHVLYIHVLYKKRYVHIYIYIYVFIYIYIS